jgi:hypothetical protein
VKVLLVNASHPAYNLGLAKAARFWERAGADVEFGESFPELLPPDVVWISAVFSWDVPRLIDLAQRALERGIPVEVGGPGTFGVRDFIRGETGLEAQSVPDGRFEREPGSYRAVFWSRGCPAKNCTLGFPRDGRAPICSVPAMEGWRYTLYTDTQPARVILDNNLSALPRYHQELIVERTLAAGFDTVDANSGFEPRSLRPWVVDLWKRLPLVAWRFAYDELAERAAVIRAIELLDAAGVSRRKLRIYCLAGNEPIEACERRVCEITTWGAYPIVQRRRPLDYLGGPLPTLHDWTEKALINFQRWGNRLAKGPTFAEYKPNFRDPIYRGEELFSEVAN